jgi:hypothetical protein
MTPEEIAAELRALADRIEGKSQPKADAADVIGTGMLQWDARLRGWKKSKFWHPMWGPPPDERGCWAPPDLIKKLAA